MAQPLSIVWFRLDLRLADNPALETALKRGVAIPVFIYAPEEESLWQPGAASRWWLHQSLEALDANLRQRGSRLILRRGPTLEALQQLLKETGADAVFWNRRYEPAVIARDRKIEETLLRKRCYVKTFNGGLLHEPEDIQNKSGRPFQVFTPFWRHCLTRRSPAKPSAAPKRLAAPQQWPKSVALAEFNLEPRIGWDAGLRATWQPGEVRAQTALKRFLQEAWEGYDKRRDQPAVSGTSRLSPHLHFGEITPRQIWHALKETGLKDWQSSRYLTEVGWREFSHHLLYHFPRTQDEPLRPAFKNFPWKENEKYLRAWQRGLTGFPIVDAGMRELWATGWMHNRMRMIAASFLVKDLLISWTHGARWFWDTLVDADLAQNTLGWQWTAGCGADAAPYFRVFNPVRQGEKFDAQGNYVRRWCPELAKLPDEWIHEPHKAPEEILKAANVVLGKNYPGPIVDHANARDEALAGFGRMKTGKSARLTRQQHPS